MNQREKQKFDNEINNKFGRKIGYLSNSFKNVFENEIYVTGEFFETLNKLIKFLQKKGLKKTLVFPEDQWSFSEILYNDMPLILKLSELFNFFNETIDFGISNYYISSPDLNFQWVFTICNEGDYHIAGDKKFVNPSIKYFNTKK